MRCELKLRAGYGYVPRQQVRTTGVVNNRFLGLIMNMPHSASCTWPFPGVVSALIPNTMVETYAEEVEHLLLLWFKCPRTWMRFCWKVRVCWCCWHVSHILWKIIKRQLWVPYVTYEPAHIYATRPEKLYTPLIVRSSINQRVVHGLYTPLLIVLHTIFSLLVLLRLPGVLLSCFGVPVLFFFALGRILFICCCIVSFRFCFVLFCLSHHFRKGQSPLFSYDSIYWLFFFYSSTSSTPSVRADPSSWRDTSSVVTKLRYRQVSCTR